MFDPVSVLRAVKSGPVPSAYTVLRSNPVYFERERPELFQCRTGAIIFALIWFVLIPGIDLIGSLFRDPLVSAVCISYTGPSRLACSPLLLCSFHG